MNHIQFLIYLTKKISLRKLNWLTQHHIASDRFRIGSQAGLLDQTSFHWVALPPPDWVDSPHFNYYLYLLNLLSKNFVKGNASFNDVPHLVPYCWPISQHSLLLLWLNNKCKVSFQICVAKDRNKKDWNGNHLTTFQFFFFNVFVVV